MIINKMPSANDIDLIVLRAQKAVGDKLREALRSGGPFFDGDAVEATYKMIFHADDPLIVGRLTS